VLLKSNYFLSILPMISKWVAMVTAAGPRQAAVMLLMYESAWYYMHHITPPLCVAYIHLYH